MPRESCSLLGARTATGQIAVVVHSRTGRENSLEGAMTGDGRAWALTVALRRSTASSQGLSKWPSEKNNDESLQVALAQNTQSNWFLTVPPIPSLISDFVSPISNRHKTCTKVKPVSNEFPW